MAKAGQKFTGEAKAKLLQHLKPFAKGDSRINRKGRPRRFDELLDLVTEFGKEHTPDGKTKVMDAIARVWRDNPEKFLEYRFGKVPDRIEMEGQIEGGVVFVMPRPGV